MIDAIQKLCLCIGSHDIKADDVSLTITCRTDADAHRLVRAIDAEVDRLSPEPRTTYPAIGAAMTVAGIAVTIESSQ